MKKLGDYTPARELWHLDKEIAHSPVMGPRSRWMAALDRFEEAKELGLCQHTRNPWHTLLCDSRMRVMCTLCGRMFGLHQQAADHWLTDHHNLDLIVRKVS